MNSNTGEIRYLDTLTPEEKNSGYWKKIRSLEEQMQAIPDAPPLTPMKEYDLQEESRKRTKMIRELKAEAGV